MEEVIEVAEDNIIPPLELKSDEDLGLSQYGKLGAGVSKAKEKAQGFLAGIFGEKVSSDLYRSAKDGAISAAKTRTGKLVLDHVHKVVVDLVAPEADSPLRKKLNNPFVRAGFYFATTIIVAQICIWAANQFPEEDDDEVSTAACLLFVSDSLMFGTMHTSADALNLSKWVGYIIPIDVVKRELTKIKNM